MTELLKILLTSALTIFGGVLVVVLGQIFTKAFLEPIQEQAKIVGEITHSVTYYANVDLGLISHYVGNLDELRNLEENSEAQTLKKERLKRLIDQTYEKADTGAVTLRNQASRLRTTVRIIPKYDLFAKHKMVLTREEVKTISTDLIGWSNSLHRLDRFNGNLPDYPEKISETLRIEI